jgi:hypothetical protein
MITIVHATLVTNTKASAIRIGNILRIEQIDYLIREIGIAPLAGVCRSRRRRDVSVAAGAAEHFD